jgi:hypothetical protein
VALGADQPGHVAFHQRLRQHANPFPQHIPVLLFEEVKPSFSKTLMDAELSGWVNAPSALIPRSLNAVWTQANPASVATYPSGNRGFPSDVQTV